MSLVNLPQGGGETHRARQPFVLSPAMYHNHKTVPSSARARGWDPPSYLASSSSTPSACRFSRALTMVSAGGTASQSNLMMLSMPSA